jgi:hypothetical protein
MPKGVRVNPEHDERTHAKIQTSQIINRLEKLVNGKIEMTPQQVRAAEILLKKTLPDLQAIQHGLQDGAAGKLGSEANGIKIAILSCIKGV